MDDARADLGLAFFFVGLPPPLLPTVALLRPTWAERETEEKEE